MVYDELVKAVIVNTARPDLIAEIELAVSRATLTLHRLDFFYRDMNEGIVNLGAYSGLNPKISIRKLFGSNFRKFNSIRLNFGDYLSDPLPKLNADNLFSTSNFKSASGYYIIGDTLNIKYPGNVNSLLVRWYSLPNSTRQTYNSWMADLYPHAIIDMASRDVLASLGNMEAARYFAALVGDVLPVPTGHIKQILSDNLFDDSEA